MIPIIRRERKRSVFTKPDGRRGWYYLDSCPLSLKPKQAPYFMSLGSFRTDPQEQFKPKIHEITRGHFLQFFPEVDAALQETGIELTTVGTMAYDVLQSYTRLRAEGKKKPLTEFQRLIEPIAEFLPLFDARSNQSNFLFHRPGNVETGLIEKFCPFSVPSSRGQGRLKDVIEAAKGPFVINWGGDAYHFRREEDAVFMKMLLS